MSLRSLCSRDSVTPKTRAATAGTAGSRSFAFTAASVLRCMIQPTGGTETMVGQQGEFVVDYVLYFTADPTTNDGDTFTVASPAHLINKVLRQIGEPIAQAGLNRLWRVNCEERERDQ